MTVRIATGLVQGVPSEHNARVTVYRGIPYAASTAGENRWREPQPPAPWEGVRVADKFGPVCPQIPAGSMSWSEDCLSLNVWTPGSEEGGETKTQKLPVLVWIYGGRFTSGAGSDASFEGTGLASKGIVVVTLNYRLGILGWLATPELSAESGHNASGNYGLLDQLAALRWVRDNIAAFGGDAAQVTIAGQSAGGASVGLHVLSPLSRGLFRGAINQSGFRDPCDPLLSGLSPAYRSKAKAEAQGEETVHEKGAANITELRQMDLAHLLEGNNKNDDSQWGTPPFWRPCIDGYMVPLTYGESLAQGIQADVPIMTGHNSDEGGTYLDPAFSATDYESCARQKYGVLADRFLHLYPLSETVTPREAWNEAARDNSRVTVARWAEKFHAHAKSPVYGYFFNHAPPAKTAATGSSQNTQPTPMVQAKVDRSVYTYMKNAPGEPRGAYHSAEIPYALNNLDAQDGYPWTETDRQVAESMSSYWAGFIKTGNPGEDFIRTDKTIMTLGETCGETPLAASLERVVFWNDHLASQREW
ncbi:hypothetical protein ASPZODRAFT_128698 [Penicilliopsis zonata CBS 506.65]|uniref:Carboxylic ester hydrolase n=1 Tax=Penicilliopsis zonata CBS 506.65 TaxID=1073090 RepID=A0A1L9SSA4_9EURO|nr:hypothetical protein ASPZODRAFT_128698 [Penicilliopsis zonata CBS 506.65]OJJ50088.1 hypothetical protein ASPZODRAFT_128698 [Penicilliopsis zonata CBS 506.65]